MRGECGKFVRNRNKRGNDSGMREFFIQKKNSNI